MRSVRVFVAAFAVVAASGTSAQDLEWQVTPYLWAAGIEGDVRVGPAVGDVNVDFSDLVDVLSGAAIVRVGGGNERHGFMGDLVWMQLEPDGDITTPAGVAEAEFDTLIVDVAYVRKLQSVGVELGVRYWDLELDIDGPQGGDIDRGDSWTDGYVGIRFDRQINDDWQSQIRLNIGGGGSDSTYAFELSLARALSSGNAFVFGLKGVDIDYAEASVNGVPFEIDTLFFGGTIGYMFR